MKLCQNDYLMRYLFWPSFMRIGQKLWIFLLTAIFWMRLFIFIQTLNGKKPKHNLFLSCSILTHKKSLIQLKRFNLWKKCLLTSIKTIIAGKILRHFYNADKHKIISNEMDSQDYLSKQEFYRRVTNFQNYI